MTSTTLDPLEVVVRDVGEGWLLDYAPREEALRHLHATLDEVGRLASERGLEPIGIDTLVGESQRNPHRVRAFFQALGGKRSPEMLLMVWRVTQGLQIERVDLAYERRQSFRLDVTLSNPYEESTEDYTSDNVNDAALLRHFGVMTIDGRPLFDGIYPLRTP